MTNHTTTTTTTTTTNNNNNNNYIVLMQSDVSLPAAVLQRYRMLPHDSYNKINEKH